MWRNKLTPFSHRTVKLFSTHQKTRLQNAGPLSSHLNSRTVIRYAGPDLVKFLQGMLTNDVRRFGEPVDEKVTTLATSNLPTVGTTPVYAALLTTHGRFLYDFFLYKPPRPDEKLDRTGSGPGPGSDQVEVLADVDRSVVDEVIDTLKRCVYLV